MPSNAAAITIGQSPCPDIRGEIAPLFDDGVRIVARRQSVHRR